MSKWNKQGNSPEPPEDSPSSQEEHPRQEGRPSQGDADIGLPHLNLSGLSRLPLLRQATQAECGIACLAMIAHYHGYRTDVAELRDKHPVSMRGVSMDSILDAAAHIGLGGRGIRCRLRELGALRTPCILHWEFDHFVVLKKVTRRHIIIHDPAKGARKLSFEETGRAFTGNVLELTPTPQFKKKPPPNQLKLGDLVRFDGDFFKHFPLGAILSFIAEMLILASPFFLQIVIDQVLLKGDRSLLEVLAVGFGAMAGFQVAVTALRGLTFQLLGHILSFDMSARVFQKMMSLPVEYFSSRHTGDVQHRMKSLEQIRHFLTMGAPMMIMDTIFSIVILIIMFAYHYSMTFLVVAAALLYALWRLLIFGVMRRAAGDVIIAEAEADTHFLETLRCISTLKMAARETGRENQWRNALARKMNATLRLGNLDILNRGVNEGLFGVLRVVVLFMAAGMALDGEISIGMVTAFMAYYGMFTARTGALIEQAVQLKLLQVPLMRIADIAHAMPEKGGVDGGREVDYKGAVELQQVAYRYGQAEPFVLKSVSFKVEPGEFIAVVGPSGAGKTTLMNLISTLSKASSGTVLFDGRPVQHWSLETLRRQLGVVQQDDKMTRGTIAENIALHENEVDMVRVKETARRCAVADEIEAMTMGYRSLVGDMGSTLSGGQKQRILLARALYTEPKALLLDEATAHLDPRNMKLIQRTLGELGITRIVIAHNPETVAAADRVLLVQDGVAREVPKPGSTPANAGG